MTGKDAILNYLKTHKTCSSPDVAAASGMTHTCINQAANILAKQGVLVAEARVWRTVYYRLATEEEIAGRKSTNQIFNEYLAEVHDKTLNRAFRLLAEGVRAGDVAAMRAAGIKVEAE